MNAISRRRPALTSLLTFPRLLALALLAAVAAAGAAVPDEAALRAKLGGGDRYLTHLSTDKPIYRAGEQVYVRGVILHASDRTPLPGRSDAHVIRPAQGALPAMIEIQGPRGDTITRTHAQVRDGVAGFAWTVPDNQPGGQYTVKVTHPFTGHAPAERTFEIRAYRPPRLNTQIEFLRQSYGPGDHVTATVTIERAEGGVPDDASVTAVARVDGEQVHRADATMDRQGNATASFALPGMIERGDGTLAFIIDDGGTSETAAKTIPIVLQTLDVRFYPEGGDLVSRLPNRVYVEAQRPTGEPADFKGVIVDEAGETVAEVATLHEGRGRFTFTPGVDEVPIDERTRREVGKRYWLEVTEPAGIAARFELPEVSPGPGAVIHAQRERYGAGEPITLQIGESSRPAHRITLSQRERVVAEARMKDLRGMMAAAHVSYEVTLTPPRSAGGVLRATLWDVDGQPLAERLIYREPAHQVRVEIEPTSSRYVPGDRVSLTVRTRNERGEPIAANVGLTVTDESVLEMIERRRQAPRLPVMALLEPEVKDVAAADVYLSSAEEVDGVSPATALDLLIGTQGWRRFAFVDVDAFIEAHGDAAKRVLALREEPDRVHLLGREARMGRRGMALRQPVRGAAPADVDGRLALAGATEPAQLVEAEGVVRIDRADAEPAALADAAPRAIAQLPAEAAPAARRRIEGRDGARRANVVAVREYAHQAIADREAHEAQNRRDFTETVYWHAGVLTDESTGEATIEFDLSDSVTQFRVIADAFDARGGLGTASELIESVAPFYIEPTMPLELTQGDVVRLPVTLANATDASMRDLAFNVTGPEALRIHAPDASASNRPIDLDPQQRLRRIVDIATAGFLGEASFTFTGKSHSFTDSVTRSVNVVPLGFPVEVGLGAMLEPDTTIAHRLTIPDDMVDGSLRTRITVHPTPMSNMTESMASLVRRPTGCFEQTSATTYPMAMAQQYFAMHTGVPADLIARTSEHLESGYQRLVSFECDSHGFEWFGRDPMHPGLTAFGLMQFKEMAKVREVDSAMIQRTRDRLLEIRDGEGNFELATRALHGWVPDQKLANAYVTWALLETGEPAATLAREIDAVLDHAADSDNSYVIALAANAAHLAQRKDRAEALMRRLADRQNRDGLVEGGTATIVGSRGTSLDIETTALATLAWLRETAFAQHVDRAIEWTVERGRGGRYGSTQSTVLALRAIVEYDRQRARPETPGTLHLTVNGQRVGEPIAFGPDTTGTIELPAFAHRLRTGENGIALTMSDGAAMPYALTIDYHRLQPASSDRAPLRLSVALPDEAIDEGEITEARLTLAHVGDESASMPTAIVGIPAGLEVRHDQLRELVDAGRVDAYEVIGRELVLYWSLMAPGDEIALELSLIAAVPGSYTAPASRAFPYYADEHVHWIEPLRVEIAPRQP